MGNRQLCFFRSAEGSHLNYVDKSTRNVLMFVNTTVIAYGQKISRSRMIFGVCNSSCLQTSGITSRRHLRLLHTILAPNGFAGLSYTGILFKKNTQLKNIGISQLSR